MPIPQVVDVFNNPLVAKILDAGGTAPLNLSGITYNLAKARQQPNGQHIFVTETEGYKEHVLPDGSLETERVYLVPWSVRAAFLLWARGYSWNVFAPATPTTPLTPSNPPQLSRIVPAQDPVWPSLRCMACELMQGEGAYVDDPANFVLDVDGVPVQVQLPPPQPQGLKTNVAARSIAFVDNRAGAAGLGASPQFYDGLARYKCTFRDPGFDVRADGSPPVVFLAGDGNTYTASQESTRSVVWKSRSSVQNLPLAKVASGQLVFSPGAPANIAGQVVPEPGVILLPTRTIQATWMDVPDPWFTTYDSMMGKVNADWFWAGPANDPCAPGTVLFLTYDHDRKRNVAQKVVYEVKYQLLVRPTGWNNLPAPDGNFYPVQFIGTGGTVAAPVGPPIYRSATFANLWQIGPLVSYPS